MRDVPMLALLLGCASQPGAQAAAERAVGVRGFGRQPGMAIGTGPASSARTPLDEAAEAVPAELRNVAHVPVPQLAPALAQPADQAPPCSRCVELQVDVSDINQRDEFAMAVGGTRVERVVWTVLVNFNSDQLAVQPFIDDVYGKYTSLHVNTFPLGIAVEVVQELHGRAAEARVQHVGLKVGSSGAWTGNQTMSVFVSELRIEGASARHELFDAGPAGLQPRTQSRNPRVVFHAPQPKAAAPAAALP